MTIEPGQPIPQATIQIKTEEGVDAHETAEYCATGRTVIFAVPGAFTATCSAKHLPGFVEKGSRDQGKGRRYVCLPVGQ